MSETRPIDEVRTDVLELQAQAAEIRAQLDLLWRHALIVTVAVLLVGAWLWLVQSQ